jgi:hypothetical protein
VSGEFYSNKIGTFSNSTFLEPTSWP